MKRRYMLEFTGILLGTLIMTLGLNLFLVPNKISAGGVITIATVLLYAFKIPLSVTNVACNIFLFFFAYKHLGKAAVIKTLSGIAGLSFFLELTAGIPAASCDYITASITGGALLGLGVGIVLRCNGSTGGSDLAALIINRLMPHVSISNSILIIDFFTVIIAGVIFKNFQIVFYSMVSIFIFSKITDAILTSGNHAKLVHILSDNCDTLAEVIMARFKRGVTGIRSIGMFSREDKTMLMCVTSAKELPLIINLIRKTDENSFIIISDAHEVFGNGFKQSTVYDNMKNF